MTGFEPRISGVGSEHSTNCTTTTAWKVDNNNKGCRHSSVDSSEPTILPPQVQVPSTPSMLLSFIGSQICANLSCEKNENKHLAHLENNLLFKKRGKFISEMRPTYLTSFAYPQ